MSKAREKGLISEDAVLSADEINTIAGGTVARTRVQKSGNPTECAFSAKTISSCAR